MIMRLAIRRFELDLDQRLMLNIYPYVTTNKLFNLHLQNENEKYFSFKCPQAFGEGETAECMTCVL